MQAIILAAGYATRLKEIAAGRAKALLPIGEKPIINFILDQMAGIAGLHTVHVVSNHKFAADFEVWAEKARRLPRYSHMEINVWDDGTTSNADRLGAIGDIQFTIDKADIDDDLLIIAGDNFFTFPLVKFYEFFQQTGCDSICATRFADPAPLTAMAVATLDADGRVLSLEEKPVQPKSDIGVYALYLYRRDTVPMIAQYLAEGNNKDSPGNFPSWLYTRKAMTAYLFEGRCIDIGTPDSYNQAVREFGCTEYD